MALANDIMHGYGPSNEMLPPKKTKVYKVALVVNIAEKDILCTVHY